MSKIILKKIFAVFILTAIFFSGGKIFAATSKNISASQMALGGVFLYRGMYENNFVKIYGLPDQAAFIYGAEPKYYTKQEMQDFYERGGSYTKFKYGNSVFIQTGEGGIIDSIFVTANNGWKTPAGIGVGSSIDAAVKIYGEPRESKKKGDLRLYIYRGDLISFSEIPVEGSMLILFNKKTKKIQKLGLVCDINFTRDSDTIKFMFGEADWITVND